MNILSKEKKLIKIFNKTFFDPKHYEHLQELLKKLHFTQEEVLKGFLDYNLDIKHVQNDVYYLPINSFVLHIHNLIEGSWHQVKQDLINHFFLPTETCSIAEIGFGVPSRYVRDVVLRYEGFTTTLCDLNDAAFSFSEALLSEWDADWRKKVFLKKMDFNQLEYLGDFDVYIFPDCIDHSKHPAEYLSLQVKEAPAHAKFLIILIARAAIEMHSVVWSSPKEIEQWIVGCGLKISAIVQIPVDKNIDIFVEDFDCDFLFFICSKT